MTDILHKNITETDLHELKGASIATSGQVPVSDGAGSTVFQKLGTTSIDSTSIKILNTYTSVIDVEAPYGVFTHYVVLPYACTLTNVYGVLDSAPNATLNIGVYNASSTLIGSLAFLSTDTPPTVKTLAPVSSNTFAAGSCIKISNSAAVTSAGKLSITLVFSV